jgi:hypothetical protein
MAKHLPAKSALQLAAVMISAACSFNALGQGAIDTTSSWAFTPFLSQIGEEGSTFGQTFTVPSGAGRLNEVSLWLRDAGFSPVKYGVYLSAWNGSRAVGPLLYQSGMQTLSQEVQLLTPQNIVLQPGGIAVTPGSQYILFVTSSEFVDGDFDRGSVGVINNDVYAGGGVYYQPNGYSLAQLTAADWQGDYSSLDLPFRVIFSAVPEPSSVLLLLVGGVALVGGLRRKL